MDYDFSHIPVGQPSKRLRLNSRWGIRTAYGQLIAMVFIPICVLALVGATLVLMETSRSAKAEQEAHAQAILSRYQPVVISLAAILNQDDGQSQAHDILQAMLIETHLNRAAVLDFDGRPRIHIGKGAHVSWPEFEKKREYINGLRSDMGHVYGVRAGLSADGPVWLMVDLDNQPMRIAQYRVWLALAVTGLITILLLLLCLNVYAKRWIAPIYEMRMHLQHTDASNLYQPMHVVSSGELNMLQRDIVFLLRRLHVSYQELKEYAEQTEDDLRNAFDEMELQTISIRNARDAAVSASAAKSAFLANISHELRTPLNSIDGFINLLSRKQNLTNEQNMYVQTIRKSSAHLLALVNDVLDFSKIEAGKLVLDAQDVDLYAVIYDVVDMLTPLAAEKGIDLAVFYYEDVPSQVIADELRCKQILTNLVSNALKFTDAGEVIVRVSLAERVLPNDKKTQQEHIVISVQDSGAGVSVEGRQHLFKSFSQADPSITRQYGGTGLGLVISKQLVQLMGGEIGHLDNAAENVAATGSTFWFSLPETQSLRQPMRHVLAESLHVLACISHEASMQVLSGLVTHLGADMTRALSTASLLDKLKSDAQSYDWLIVDGQDDALLRGIRDHFHGHVAAFGYQVSLDFDLLKQYQMQALYQPINRRSLLNLFQHTLDSDAQPALAWEGKHVLAVDDHMPNLLVLDALLSELGVGVTTVTSGYEAIETFNRRNLMGKPFDLVFMDIQMPRMSGLEAATQIRTLEKQLHKKRGDDVLVRTPIIALTAHALADERERLLASGVDDYVGKPISHPQLVSVLKKWFDGVESQVDRDITIGALAAVSLSYGQLKSVTVEDIAASMKTDESSAGAVRDAEKSLADMQSVSVGQDDMNAGSSFDNSFNNSLDNQWHAPADPQTVFDWQDALSRAANKVDLARDILRLLLESLPQEKAELAAAWQAKDMPLLGQVVHRIVGGTRYTGTVQLRAMAQQLQQQCISQQDVEPDKAQAVLFTGYHQMLQAMDNLIQLDLSAWDALADMTHPSAL